MKSRFTAIVARYLFVSSFFFAVPLSAENTVVFGGFGGGLPSSAMIVTEEECADIALTPLSASSGQGGSDASKVILAVTAGVVITALVLYGVTENVKYCGDKYSESWVNTCSSDCYDTFGSSIGDWFQNQWSSLWRDCFTSEIVFIP